MKLKYSIKGQIILAVLAQLKTVFVCFALWFIAIAITASKIGGAIYTVFAILFYCISLYSECCSQAANDKKSYSPLTPHIYKGALLSVGVLIINVAVILLHIYIWKTAGSSGNLESLSAVAANVFCLFWLSPFINFLSMQKGTVLTAVYAAGLILPVLSCFLGYLAGYKNFDISTKFRFLIYEKQKKD